VAITPAGSAHSPGAVSAPPAAGEARADSPPQWAPTRALARAVLLTGVLLIGAVLLGRADLVVLAVPFAVGTAVALRRRPERAPEVRLAADHTFLAEGGDVAATISVRNRDVVAYDLVVVRSLISPWLRIERGDRPFVSTIAPRGAADVELAGSALRWGRHPIGPAAAQPVACDGLLLGRPAVTGARGVRVYPVTEPFDADEAMPRAAGLVGAHRSRRPGEGGELAGVRMFAPGDRLRRVDWRVTLRTQQLHVAATLSDRDAEVVLLLDVLAEAGRSGGVHGSASVLDTTVRAAAAIAEHYLQRGDRVSMLEYGPAARRLRPASGRRQYLTVLEWLLDVRPLPSPYEPYEQVFGRHLLSSNALVVVLTPLIDARSAEMLARLARSGRFVVAVDTLPESASPAPRGPWTPVAYRLWRLERDNTMGQLREHGIPVVAWAGAGSLDLVLRDVARMASAPKAVFR
jgi:uncharacterized protein (DUF58 family)